MQPVQQSVSEQPAVHRAGLELLDRLREIDPAVGDDHLAGDEVLADLRRLQEAAADGEERAGTGARRVELARGD